MSLRDAARLALRYAAPFATLRGLPSLPGRYSRYFSDRRRYRALGGEALQLTDGYPCLDDATADTAFDAHYFFQEAWAARHIARLMPSAHVDVGSRLAFVAAVSAFVPVKFVDIRPMRAELSGCTVVKGSLLALPFQDASVSSLSCLHVIEHIGLGRYGDPLDPDGSRKAASELSRVLAPGGTLLLSAPVGRPRTMFNAHRIHSPSALQALFPELRLEEFSGVDDAGNFIQRQSPDALSHCSYACGFYLFRRGARAA